MSCYYKIVDIVHSGRKGVRNTQRDDEKYDGIWGSIVKTKRLEDIQQFSEIRWEFVATNSEYEWWRTSPVIQISLGFDDLYRVETANTIYVMQKMGETANDQNDDDVGQS